VVITDTAIFHEQDIVYICAISIQIWLKFRTLYAAVFAAIVL